ncbi:cystathionine beta-synthase-like [Cylas formicarius]|uniref:cystathionine beta-synthase-like n=1 Tax=Cylas formicarius TaxID=197179 RepID=UPI0029583D18|nr:cystathionine beta-synthase-like [Cylas formicarius]
MSTAGKIIHVSPMNAGTGFPKDHKCAWRENFGKNVPIPHTKHDWRPSENLKIHPDVTSLMGHTPMVKLNRIPKEAGLKCNVYAKCEFLSPGGSIKDRMAKRMFDDYERQGILKPGMTIIEASSGNTGIAFALLSAIRGYKCIIVLHEKISHEKEMTIKSLGAEVVRVPADSDDFSPEGFFGVTCKLRKEIPNSIILDQFSNPGNPLSHYDTTAEEILDQTDRKVDMILLSAGTGGTMTGIGRKFREVSPITKIIGFDPYGSQYAHPDSLNETDVKLWEIEGLGYFHIPSTLDRTLCDYWVKVSDAESLLMARRLMKEEGLLVGPSSGAAVAAAVKVGQSLKEGDNLVLLLPDGIRNYMTKFVSDQWMEAKGHQPCSNPLNKWWWERKVADLGPKPPITLLPTETLAGVLRILKEKNAQGAAVVNESGFLVGTVHLNEVKTGLVSGNFKRDDVVKRCTHTIPLKVTKDDTLGRVSRILEKDPIALVIETVTVDGETKVRPAGIVDLDDLLTYTS